MKTMKESQRRKIWKALRCIEASNAIGLLVTTGHEELAHEQRKWESKAHSLWRDAGFEDVPTSDLRGICARVCDDYENGRLEVIPFE